MEQAQPEIHRYNFTLDVMIIVFQYLDEYEIFELQLLC